MTTRRITLTAATVGQLDLALAVATLAVLEVVHTIIPDGGGLATATALVPFVAPLAVRHRWPLAALLASTAVVLIQNPFGQILTSINGDQAVPMILSYGAGAWLPIRPAVVALASALVMLIVWAVFPPGGGGVTPLSQVAGPTFYVVMLLVPTWSVARVIRRDRESARESAELAEATLALSRDEAEAAVVAERERISVELHDIIAHSVSAMVVQAGSARLLLRTDRERARESLSAIERTGRDTLTDLRSLLGMLRRQEAQ
jgi:signal transduction histidine kinase